jgi:suppressor of tumorigenicity protein 13
MSNQANDSEPESDVELDKSCVIAAETEAPPPMGDPDRAVSEQDEDSADAERSTGMRALADGNWADAVQHLTKAIELNPQSAIFFAKRATYVILSLSKMHLLQSVAESTATGGGEARQRPSD